VKAVLVGIMLVCFTATPALAEGRGPCSGWFSNIRHTMPQEKVIAHTKLTIACAERIWPVSGGLSTALAIADRESHFDPEAYNPSGCAGVFQHRLTLWAGRVASWWNRSWFWKVPRAFNMRANVIVTMRMVHADGWGPWS
jgi:hypothetical protein